MRFNNRLKLSFQILDICAIMQFIRKPNNKILAFEYSKDFKWLWFMWTNSIYIFYSLNSFSFSFNTNSNVKRSFTKITRTKSVCKEDIKFNGFLSFKSNCTSLQYMDKLFSRTESGAQFWTQVHSMHRVFHWHCIRSA